MNFHKASFLAMELQTCLLPAIQLIIYMFKNFMIESPFCTKAPILKGVWYLSPACYCKFNYILHLLYNFVYILAFCWNCFRFLSLHMLQIVAPKESLLTWFTNVFPFMMSAKYTNSCCQQTMLLYILQYIWILLHMYAMKTHSRNKWSTVST